MEGGAVSHHSTTILAPANPTFCASQNEEERVKMSRRQSFKQQGAQRTAAV
jgi:hypothetical protein